MFNFDNIGDKIKKLAKVVFIMDTVLAIIGGLVSVVTMFVQSIEYENPMLLFVAVLLIPIIVFLAVVLAWISVWLLYGFGDLVESNREIAESKKYYNYYEQK